MPIELLDDRTYGLWDVRQRRRADCRPKHMVVRKSHSVKEVISRTTKATHWHYQCSSVNCCHPSGVGAVSSSNNHHALGFSRSVNVPFGESVPFASRWCLDCPPGRIGVDLPKS